MGFETVPFTKNRQVIYDMLTRARRFHCSVNGTYNFDVTETLQRLREARRAGRSVSFTALLVQATSQLLERYPRLNRHIFHGLFGRRRVVAFDHVSCTLIVQRSGPDGEAILFPLVLRDSNRMTLEEIYKTIQHHRTADLETLPQMVALERLKRLPGFVLRWISYKIRSDPRFYERYFGTYGLSSLMTMGWGLDSGATLANVCSTFLPATISERPVCRDGKVEPRRMLTMMCVFDHYILDGQEMTQAMKALRPMLESPSLE
ncbi:MAG: 2-oxo acid dehydrogenase subunit E2 [Planctomycetota bacterium]